MSVIFYATYVIKIYEKFTIDNEQLIDDFKIQVQEKKNFFFFASVNFLNFP